MNNVFNPDPLGFKKMEKERVINELKEAIKKAEMEGRISDVEKLKKELKNLTHESLLKKIIEVSIMY